LATSLIYRSAFIYELVMRLLYGRHYDARYKAIAELIPNEMTVLDVCCGPAFLYQYTLRNRRVEYTGLDMNAAFIKRLIKRGGKGAVWDLREDKPLPRADYVIMQASLYHFLPDAKPIVDRLIAAANGQVIIAEPIRNLASSPSRVLAWLGRMLTDPGSGDQPHRFTEASLDRLFADYAPLVAHSFLIAGGREKVYVLNGKPL
jgi:SAM-dependent methyltransferase